MTAQYLEANLKRIALRDKELAELLGNNYRPDYPEIRASKDGSPIPVVDRKSLHSTYDPVAEAQKWLESLTIKADRQDLYVLGGVGFAYHLQELLKVVPAERLVVIEKDAALFAAALAHASVLGDGFAVDRRAVAGLGLLGDAADGRAGLAAGEPDPRRQAGWRVAVDDPARHHLAAPAAHPGGQRPAGAVDVDGGLRPALRADRRRAAVRHRVDLALRLPRGL